MKRLHSSVRPNLDAIAEQYGFGFTVVDGKTYWDESKFYQFTLRQIEDDIEDPTQEIHSMLLKAADRVISSDELLRKFAIPEASWADIRRSWSRLDPMVYGRIDLCYDGVNPAKLYEANYDTPTALFEASVFQWDWLMANHPDADQFNSIHERLIEAWKNVGAMHGLQTAHFACVEDAVEDYYTTQYMMDTALQAGLIVKSLDIKDIGIGTQMVSLQREETVFTDLQDEEIEMLFKLYPWEHMLREDFAQYIGPTDTRFIEPMWKAVISNKAMMALLWEMFPGHKNLIETYFIDSPEDVKEGFVAKPFFSREGAGIIIPGVDSTEEEEDHGGYIMQKYTPLPEFEGSYPVIGSWVVNGVACGIGIREDDTLITKNTSRFVPHLIMD